MNKEQLNKLKELVDNTVDLVKNPYPYSDILLSSRLLAVQEFIDNILNQE